MHPDQDLSRLPVLSNPSLDSSLHGLLLPS